MRNEIVRYVMAAIRCAVVMFKRVYCIPIPASSMDRVGGMVAEWFSMYKRLIFRSVSNNVSLQLEEEVEREVWDSLEADSWAVLRSEWEQYCYEIQINTFDCC